MLLENFCQLWTRHLLSLKKCGKEFQDSVFDGERQCVTCSCIAAGRTRYRFLLPPDNLGKVERLCKRISDSNDLSNSSPAVHRYSEGGN